MENKIKVYYNNKLVGFIARLDDKYAFEYDDDWLLNGFSISPFSLPLKKEVFIPSKTCFNGFFGVFADSLPDSWGELLFNRYIRKKGIKEFDGIYRLACIGKKGMGALEYVPDMSIEDDDVINLDDFQIESNNVLNDEGIFNIDTLYSFGGSSGGARPKALVKIDNEDYIVKFQSKYDIKEIGLCEYEYACVCKEIGIKIPDVKLFPSKTSMGYFGIKRFDRDGDKKIHMISAAALLEVDFKSPCADYSDLFKLTKIITKDNKEDVKQLYLRMCFNVYAHNLDDHLKNFSYIYDENIKSYRLSPAYDMVYSNTYYGEHQTTVNNKGKDIDISDLVYVGTKAGLNKEYAIKNATYIKKIVEDKLKKYLI